MKMPKEGENILKYQEGSKSIRVPFVIYADTEYILKPIQDNDPYCTYNDPKCENKHEAFTRNINEHEGSGNALLIKFALVDYEEDFKHCRGDYSV